ncbi:MarR family transcriptional regulator [Haloterrigena salifodinae]|uniref:MarR family transcriptional regulator n=1 Tax=Haloterrigena salifodinae TaxID=2675099 RepID=UPI002011125E|nr:MarR family transcriptional regulator [Haloterrigena salifodinae]
MSATTTIEDIMLEEEDLGPADEALLDMLNEGRVTAPYVADETGYSLQYVRDRLGRLVEHGNARKVYEGLYELVEDPRKNGNIGA